jgi:hypothetical protein
MLKKEKSKLKNLIELFFISNNNNNIVITNSYYNSNACIVLEQYYNKVEFSHSFVHLMIKY